VSDDFFKDLVAYAERRIEKISSEISRRFEEEMQRRLDDWGQRYPRHQFEAYQGHGMLAVRVSPPLGSDKHKGREWTNIDDLPDHMLRGAIAELYGEVREVIQAHVRLEWKLSTFDFGPLLSPEPKGKVEDEPSPIGYR